jgi:hypothetical protein
MFKSFFYSNSKEKKIFILYVTIIAGLALIISLIVIIASTPKTITPEQSEIAEHDIYDTDNRITLEEFIIPDPWVRVHETKFHSFRDQLSSWGEEQIKQYWISPRKISIEILSKKNDKYIKEIFEGIP